MNPNLLGGIEIAAVVAVILLGMVTVQIYVYYVNFRYDSRIIKTLIAIVWVTETGHVVGICYGLYRMTITRYGHLDLPIPLELCMAAILGNVIHPLVQAIFTARIYQLGTNVQNRFLAAVCWAISGFNLGATILLSIKVFSATSIDQFEDQWNWLILGLFGATGGVDLLIAASMCYYTLKNRALMKPERGKIDTVISWTTQTGLLTCMAAITVAVCFATMKQDHIWLPLLILTTGLYSNSLLSLLNGRLHLGYQTPDPFMISLSTFRQSTRSRGQIPFSHPPTVHLRPPSPLAKNTNSVSDGQGLSTHAGSMHTGLNADSIRAGSIRGTGASGILAAPSLHYTMARELRFPPEPA
ncbi:hypothetical protein DFH06DRAFT_194464 [Mycena polygramma]|nr:hypothetical protein DFH06DRAFT_194464 [Mycena polygramma]